MDICSVGHMETCSDGHDEICYTVALCPMCLIIKELKGYIGSLKQDIIDLENEIRRVQDE